jgi:hypothetical protein
LRIASPPNLKKEIGLLARGLLLMTPSLGGGIWQLFTLTA